MSSYEDNCVGFGLFGVWLLLAAFTFADEPVKVVLCALGILFCIWRGTYAFLEYLFEDDVGDDGAPTAASPSSFACVSDWVIGFVSKHDAEPVDFRRRILLGPAPPEAPPRQAYRWPDLDPPVPAPKMSPPSPKLLPLERPRPDTDGILPKNPRDLFAGYWLPGPPRPEVDIRPAPAVTVTVAPKYPPRNAVDQESLFFSSCQELASEVDNLKRELSLFASLFPHQAEFLGPLRTIRAGVDRAFAGLSTLRPSGMTLPEANLTQWPIAINALYMLLQPHGYLIERYGNQEMKDFAMGIQRFTHFLGLSPPDFDMAEKAIITSAPPPVVAPAPAALPAPAIPAVPAVPALAASVPSPAPLAPAVPSAASIQQAASRHRPRLSGRPRAQATATLLAAPASQPAAVPAPPAVAPQPPITASQPPVAAPQSSKTASSFEDQDWSLSTYELLELTKDSWGWDSQTLLEKSLLFELLWVEEEPTQETAECKTLKGVEERLNSISTGLMKAAIVFRLQLLEAGKSDILMNEIGDKTLGRARDLLRAYAKSQGTKTVEGGDFTAFAKPLRFLQDKVLTKHGNLIKNKHGDATLSSLNRRVETVGTLLGMNFSG